MYDGAQKKENVDQEIVNTLFGNYEIGNILKENIDQEIVKTLFDSHNGAEKIFIEQLLAVIFTSKEITNVFHRDV